VFVSKTGLIFGLIVTNQISSKFQDYNEKPSTRWEKFKKIKNIKKKGGTKIKFNEKSKLTKD